MYDPFVGEVMAWGGNFAPRGWAFCDGQTLSIAQNQVLFAVIGNAYGGDGRTTFAVPDMRDRVPRGSSTPEGPYRQRPNGGSDATTVLPWRPATDASDNTQVVAYPATGELDTTPPSQAVTYVIALDGNWPVCD